MNEPIAAHDTSLPPQPVPACAEVPRLAAPASPDLSVALIVLTVGVLVGTILYRSELMYSPNDSSRLNTVYYLVQHGTYEFKAIPRSQMPAWAIRPTEPDPANPAKRRPVECNPADPGSMPVLWTIDMIRVNGKLYSSKPPMYSTCLAGITWLAQKVSGRTMQDNPWMMIRTMLIVAQVLPLAVALLVLRRHVFLASESPFVRNLCMLAACAGTYLTPWSVTINNHVPAAATGLIAVDAGMRIWYEGRREWYWFTIAGFFAALTATFELPAGLLAAGLFVALLIKDRRRALIFGLVVALIPAAIALYTNHVVTGQFMPAYDSWNKPGGFYDYKGSYWNDRKGIDALNEPAPVYLTHILVGHDGFFSLTPVLLVALLGMLIELVRRDGRRIAALVTILATATVICTYLLKTRNYGGGCQGFRWLFWVVPLWLLFLPTGVALLSRCAVRRFVLYICLAVSVFSVSIAWANPWTSTWIRVLLNRWGWINY